MHIESALITTGVAIATYAVSGSLIAFSGIKLRKERKLTRLEEKNTVNSDKLRDNPFAAGLLAAAVFGLQMVNVTIAGTGSSGHFVGAILLAYLLGPYLGLISMSAILTVQCLFFADGGIIALGANILNMGVIPCLIIFPLITKLFKKSGNKVERDAFSLAFASYLSVIAGSIMVAVETLPLAGLSFAEFALQMLSIHALIGLIEIVLTITIAGIFTAIELSPLNYNKRIIVTLSSAAFLAFISAGILSLFASSFPDGLEWSVMRVTDTIATAPVDEFFALHALFPDYALRSSELLIGTSISGIIGAFFVWAFMTLPRLPIYKRIKSNT